MSDLEMNLQLVVIGSLAILCVFLVLGLIGELFSRPTTADRVDAAWERTRS